MVGRAHEQCLIHDKQHLGSTFFFRGHKNHPASLVTVVASRPSAPTKPSKVSTFTGIVEIGIEKPRTCRRFCTPTSLLNLKSVNSHRDREGQGRDTPNLDPLGVQEVATVTGIVSWLVSLECLKKVPKPKGTIQGVQT